jgi:FtsP/CotA-like multicopper oxidase with cupredoxin domain
MLMNVLLENWKIQRSGIPPPDSQTLSGGNTIMTNTSLTRSFYKIGVFLIMILTLAVPVFAQVDEIPTRTIEEPPLEIATPFRVTPFVEELPIPPVVQPVAPFANNCAQEFEGLGLSEENFKFYEIVMKEATHQIVPGIDTAIWGYDGMFPGPTFKARHNEPAIVRFVNDVNASTIVHLHGGHLGSKSDGSADVNPEMLIHPGQSRVFCYSNIAPVENGQQQMSDFPSTMWYHDHGHIPELHIGTSGQNIQMGLAGFYLVTDDIEQGLIDSGVLPGPEHDIPLMLADKILAPDGSMVYDVNGFDGHLGDILTVNGKAQPKFTVERRKYRFRILNGSNARWWELRLSTGEPLLSIGKDSWLHGRAVVPVTFDADGQAREGTVRLGNAERAEVIIDFTNAPNEVFLENILIQDDGSRPDKEVAIPGIPLVKFEVQGEPVQNDVTITAGTELRPFKPILEEEIVVTRVFEFDRNGGKWTINSLPYDPHKDDAEPTRQTAERWVLKNPAGGWAHPIHIHLEGFQIQRSSLHPVPPHEQFLNDTVKLEPNEIVEVFIKFRTFSGRYVFHCHNLEHEDLSMMGIFNVDSTPLPSFDVEPGHLGEPPMIEIL